MLDWKLLKSVSRSFYLTLRLLPESVRDSIALAYLLARLSDTKADGAETAGEKLLLTREKELVDLLKASPDREEIEEVWKTIQEGQDFDKERFSRKKSTPLTPEELDRYTYMVAGSVGVFWTKLCAKKIRIFACLREDDMLGLGTRYGKGLQLVNILRDRAADQAKGRVYVPAERVEETFSLAEAHLRAARTYVKALHPRRLRLATALPLLLANKTLELLKANPQAGHVKVPRSQVWRLLWQSLFY